MSEQPDLAKEVARWIEKAEHDFLAAEHSMKLAAEGLTDIVAFHCQQCAEKYLKARLTEADVEFAKIHDLVALLDEVLVVQPTWDTFRADLAFLSDFAVGFRYPGESADRESARDARRRCRAFRVAAREALGLGA